MSAALVSLSELHSLCRFSKDATMVSMVGASEHGRGSFHWTIVDIERMLATEIILFIKILWLQYVACRKSGQWPVSR